MIMEEVRKDVTSTTKNGRVKGVIANSFRELSPMKQGRFHALQPRYKSQTLELVNQLPSRGKNSFEEVTNKSDEVNKAKGELKSYYRSVTEATTLGADYDASEITAIICDKRSVDNQPRFKGAITRQCIAEFQKLFVITEHMKPDAHGKPRRVYRPMFALYVN